MCCGGGGGGGGVNRGESKVSTLSGYNKLCILKLYFFQFLEIIKFFEMLKNVLLGTLAEHECDPEILSILLYLYPFLR